MNAEQEEKYWLEKHAEQPYANKDVPAEHYAPAYRAGIDAAQKYPGRKFEEIEDEVSLNYEKARTGAALPWDHARHAVHAAWAKLSGDISPRDPDRGIRGSI